MTLAPGAVFAGRRIEALVSRGAGTALYRATDAHGRKVALKVFEALAGDERVVQRFMREWGAAGAIAHPNLIQLYECGEAAGTPFVEMPYIDGPDLADLVRTNGRLNPVFAARVVAQATAGVSAAHSRGVVHRNLRPSKILIGAGETVVVTGLCEPVRAFTAESSGLVGSMDFVAPEQVVGEGVSAGTDVYLLAYLLAYAITGRTLAEIASGSAPGFAGLLALIEGAFDLPEEIPAMLREPIERALARDPGHRPGASEFGQMLAHAHIPSEHLWIETAPPPAPPVQFQVLDTIVVHRAGADRRIDLCMGDLTELPACVSCEVLVVSAIPGSYFPTASSLIGALARKGLSVEDLAQRKAVDLRETCSCWLSQPLPADVGLGYKRILCFEPANEASPGELVGDIFRALLPFLGDSGFRTVAMPVVSSGDAGYPVAEMLAAVIEAAVNWMSLGVSLERLLVFAPLAPAKRERALARFAELKRSHAQAASPQDETWEFDVFVSYAHENAEHATFIVDELEHADPGLRLFVDRHRLNPGSSWQHEIFDALDVSNKVMALFSPAYVRSKVCKEEFNIAWARGRELDRQVLFPLYLFTAPLPTYMKLVQYVDCREGSRELLAAACRRMLASGAE